MGLNPTTGTHLYHPRRTREHTGLRAALAAIAAALSRRLVGDVGKVADGLERVGRGELWTEVPVDGSDDLRRLALGVNALARQMRESAARADARELALISTLGQVAEGRTPESAQHMLRVGIMSQELARLAGLPAAEAELLRQAAPLHDIGKAGMAEELRSKTGAYTAREREAMQGHTELGHRILIGSSRPELRAAAEIALSHHERWDGMGYPGGLAGEAIPLHGRIVGLVDSFDAMFSDRPHRRAMSRDHALGIIRSQRACHFDPVLTDLLLDNLPVFLGIMERYVAATPERRASASTRRKPSTVGA